MADFNVGVQDVQPDAGRVVPAGPDNSTANAINQVGSLLNGFGSVFSDASKLAAKQQLVNNKASAVAQITEQQLKLAQAVDQGTMSSSAARMKARANLSQAIANNPLEAEAIQQAHAAIFNTKAGADIIDTGTVAERQQAASRAAAQTHGFGSPTDSIEEQDRQSSIWLQIQHAETGIGLQTAQTGLVNAQLETKAKQIGIVNANLETTSKKLSIQNAQISLQNNKDELNTRHGLAMLADGFGQKHDSDIQKILDERDWTTATPEQRLEAQARLDQIRASTTGTVTTTLQAGNGGAFISGILTPFKMREEAALDVISGKRSGDAYTQASTNAVAIQTANMTSDPKVAALAGVSKMFQHISGSLQQAIDSNGINLIDQNSAVPNLRGNNTPEGSTAVPKTTLTGAPSGGPANLISGSPDANRSYLSAMKVAVTKTNNGTIDDPAAQKEVANNINNVLHGIVKFGPTSDHPKEFNDAVQFLASPDYGKYVTQHGTGINQATAGDAQQVISTEYEAHVLPLLKQEYEKTTVPLADTANLNPFAMVDTKPVRDDLTLQSVTPVFAGGGVTFQPTKNGDTDAAARAKDLNKNVAPILNTLVKMSAHLNGNTDYAKAWDTKYKATFAPPAPQAKDDQG